MGELVRYQLGTRQEMSEEHPQADRQRHDVAGLIATPAQLEGKYYFAETADARRPPRSRRCRTRSFV